MKIAVYSMRSDERPYFEQIKTPLIESEKIVALGLDIVEGEEGTRTWITASTSFPIRKWPTYGNSATSS